MPQYFCASRLLLANFDCLVYREKSTTALIQLIASIIGRGAIEWFVCFTERTKDKRIVYSGI